MAARSTEEDTGVCITTAAVSISAVEEQRDGGNERVSTGASANGERFASVVIINTTPVLDVSGLDCHGVVQSYSSVKRAALCTQCNTVAHGQRTAQCV